MFEVQSVNDTFVVVVNPILFVLTLMSVKNQSHPPTVEVANGSAV